MQFRPICDWLHSNQTLPLHIHVPAHFSIQTKVDEEEVMILLLHHRRTKRRVHRYRYWVHPTIAKRHEFGKYHRLVQELRLDSARYRQYFRMSPMQFENILAQIKLRQ